MRQRRTVAGSVPAGRHRRTRRRAASGGPGPGRRRRPAGRGRGARPGRRRRGRSGSPSRRARSARAAARRTSRSRRRRSGRPRARVRHRRSVALAGRSDPTFASAGRPASGDPPRVGIEPAAVLARALAAALVELPLGVEDRSELEQLADGAVGMAARAAAGELLATSARSGRGRRRSGWPVGDARRRVGDRPEAEHARPALGGALAGHAVHDPGRRPDAAAVVAEERDDAAAERGAGVAQGDRVERQVATPRSATTQPPK